LVSNDRGHSRREREKLRLDLADADILDVVGADQVAYYTARSPWYDDVYTNRGDYDRGPERNAQWLVDLATIEAALSQAPIHGACVELGAGTGYWTERVVDRVDHIWALDASPEVLELARRRLSPRAANVEFQAVDLWRWQPDRLWDCALACFFLEHVPDEVLPRLLNTLHRSLQPGGTMFVAEGGASGVEPPVETREIAGRTFRVVERRRTEAELATAFARAGFSTEITNFSHYVYLTAAKD